MANEILSSINAPKMRIDRKFLPVKFALFFWFAGAIGIIAFMPVFLKHQGLTIAHLSIFYGLSVGVQFSAGVISAFLADKIGRIKPFWYFFYVLFCTSCLIFSTLPRVPKCNAENVSFSCYNEEILHLNATSCEIIPNNPREILCSKITTQNGRNLVNQNETLGFVTLFPKFDISFETENLNNISGVYTSVADCLNCSFKNISSCTSEICKSFQIDCSAHIMDCNQNAKFWLIIYGMLFILHDFSRTNVFRFNDIIASDLTSVYNSDFGRQRVFSIFGAMTGPPLIGIILNAINGSNDNEKSYTWLFFCSIIFATMSAFSVGLLKPKFHKPATKMWKKSYSLLKNLDVILFFALLIIMGCVTGFQNYYRNWYLKQLGASDLLTGIVTGSSNLYGIVFLYKSKWFIHKIGVRNVFVLGLIGNIVCCFSFSVIREPWIAVIIESTTIVSYHLFYVAIIQFADDVAPEGLVAIVKLLSGALLFNIGKLGSSLVGGYVMNPYGGKAAFTVLGCITLAYLFVYGTYLIILHLKQRKTRARLETVKADSENTFSK